MSAKHTAVPVSAVTEKSTGAVATVQESAAVNGTTTRVQRKHHKHSRKSRAKNSKPTKGTKNKVNVTVNGT